MPKGKRDRLHSIKSGADFLTISPWTLRKYLSEGRNGIQKVKCGRRTLVWESQLMKLIDAPPSRRHR